MLCQPDQRAILILSTFSRSVYVTHLQISAIVAVGAVEGLSHVNWSLYLKLVAWWYLGCIPVFFFTALLTWQGEAPGPQPKRQGEKSRSSMLSPQGNNGPPSSSNSSDALIQRMIVSHSCVSCDQLKYANGQSMYTSGTAAFSCTFACSSLHQRRNMTCACFCASFDNHAFV